MTVSLSRMKASNDCLLRAVGMVTSLTTLAMLVWCCGLSWRFVQAWQRSECILKQEDGKRRWQMTHSCRDWQRGHSGIDDNTLQFVQHWHVQRSLLPHGSPRQTAHGCISAKYTLAKLMKTSTVKLESIKCNLETTKIDRKTWQIQSRHYQNWNSHTSKIR